MSNVVIKSRDDCKFCYDAKGFLTGMEVSYTEEYQPYGTVPEIFVNGISIGGYEDLISLSQTQSEWDATFNVETN